MSIDKFLKKFINIVPEKEKLVVKPLEIVPTQVVIDYSNSDRNKICKEYLNNIVISIPTTQSDEHLTEWNKGRLNAYSILLGMLDTTSPEDTVKFAKERAEFIHSNTYTVFNSGMYEVYRTWSSVDINALIIRGKLQIKRNAAVT